jgi:carboxyl-terminal processing protease
MQTEEIGKQRRRPNVAGKMAAAILVCAVLVIGGAGAGYKLGTESALGQQQTDMRMFWKAWNIIDRDFYGELNDDERVKGAVAGMVASLDDPYSVFLEEKQDRILREDLKGTFGGIGAELSVRNGQLVVVSALDGTPASSAGLKGGDIIQKIDDAAAAELSFMEAIDMIRGEQGSVVRLTILRQGEEPRELSLARDTIVVKSVTTDLIGPNDSVAYIKINQFGEDTTEAFRQALTSAIQQDKQGVVLDLRNNPGGYLTAATQMIGMVLPAQVTSTEEVLRTRTAVVQKSKKGEERMRAGTTVVASAIPLVVVIDEGSASASEIFAGAMKDYKRARVVGVKSFGKGSVQELQPLGKNGSIKITVAKWYTPLGTGIEKEGITPDVVVELPDEATRSKDDIQIQKALEVLTQKQ